MLLMSQVFFRCSVLVEFVDVNTEDGSFILVLQNHDLMLNLLMLTHKMDVSFKMMLTQKRV